MIYYLNGILCSKWKMKIMLMKKYFLNVNTFITYSWMSKQVVKVHTRIIYTEEDKFTTYFQAYYYPSHLINVGGKGEKLGYNPGKMTTCESYVLSVTGPKWVIK